MQRFAVFVSGNGTNLQAIIEAVNQKKIKAELALVFSNNRKAYALKRAEEAGIKTLCLVRKDYATPQSYDRDIVIYMKEAKIDFIVLAGYMKLLSAFFVKEFPNRILNVHPSLLPAFRGKQAIKDAFTYGAKVTGVTIHFVDDKMDHGPIIMQEGFKIPPDDTLEMLEARVHTLEHSMYPKAIQLYTEDRLKVGKGRKVRILERPKVEHIH
ncbi:MAG: phosphoribosylglycinamide formyltransferase [Omnitrophica WOR_2 bacterium GWF2_38_59]|nr:MAG: phosphoribosylglycinamide formyltransferase [Omnitrophica WOR_2 bacterium GWF2_38_59]OGX46708.1 MAG: phosphoribosylglycinamide formyltransferase [Omnitrophica WOR_2 bacterium RIFOXYA2_FULL_38_17]OGX53122.1 MAG: phosphoribosylglycinamide formyltransferase [Omnitrophica WOR_2 bacterium RIFOXYA12_FULL_38_10]OGX56579.1 MAG: phosphoribosylglycinamide formyltransferase [Omnitrophica WOR_2 bacterium RIFOXYC2_FULL_38_12]OGX59798.1 MAG: phosphoribosylglycinamide formyltransferase [Omnitrophica W